MRTPLLLAVALCLALAIPAGAAKLITGKNVKNASLTGADIKNGSIGQRDLARGVGQGPTGERGEQGPAGPKGDKGDSGAPFDISQLTITQRSVQARGRAQVQCLAGEKLTGGGAYILAGLGAPPALAYSRPEIGVDPDVWVAAAVDPNVLVNAYALCAS